MTALTTTISMIADRTASGLRQLLAPLASRLYRIACGARNHRGICGQLVYAVLVLRSLDNDVESAPQLAITISIFGVLITLGTFIWYVSRAVDMVRVDAITRHSTERTLAHADTAPPPTPRPYISTVHFDRTFRAARTAQPCGDAARGELRLCAARRSSIGGRLGERARGDSSDCCPVGGTESSLDSRWRYRGALPSTPRAR